MIEPQAPFDGSNDPVPATYDNEPGQDFALGPPETPATQPPPPGGWNYWDLLFFLLFTVPALMVATIVCIGGYELVELFTGVRMSMEALLNQTPMVVAVQIVWWALLFGFIYAVVSIKYGLRFGPAIGWRALNRPPVVFLSWGILLAISVAVFSRFIPMPTEKLPIEDLLNDRSSLVVLALFGVLIAPAIEELVFRGFLYPVIERSHGTPLAVVFTSLIFSLVHARQYGWHWQNLLLLTYVGIIFGIVRARTQSVVPSTLLHAGYNATLFAGLFAAGDQIFRT